MTELPVLTKKRIVVFSPFTNDLGTYVLIIFVNDDSIFNTVRTVCRLVKIWENNSTRGE